MKLKISLFLVLFFLVGLSSSLAQDYCDQSKMGGVPIPFDQSGKMMENCTPEFLYSWQNKDVLIKARSNPNGKLLFPTGYIYFFRTPVGTLGYGNAVLEVKLNPNVQWKFSTSRYFCDGKNPAEKNSIWAIYRKEWDGVVDWTEYIVCSPEVFQSWSFGTPEIKERMKLEYEHVLKNKGDSSKYDWFVSPHNKLFKCDSCWLGYFPWDTAKSGWEHAGMNYRLKIVDDLVKDNLGGVFSKSEDAIEEHNLFNRPTYFLPELVDKDSKIISLSAKTLNLIMGGATAAAAKFCDGKKICTYKISSRFIRDPAPNTSKNFRIKWTCGSNPEIKELLVPEDATNKVIDIVCDSDQKIKITLATFGENLFTELGDLENTISNQCIGTNPCKIQIPYTGTSNTSSSYWIDISYSCLKNPDKIATSIAEVKNGFFDVNIFCRKGK